MVGAGETTPVAQEPSGTVFVFPCPVLQAPRETVATHESRARKGSDQSGMKVCKEPQPAGWNHRELEVLLEEGSYKY